MIYRLLSATGAVAHIGDATLGRTGATKRLRRGTAPILAAMALATCAITGVFAIQAGSRTMHSYDVRQLAANTDARPGDLVKVTGHLSPKYTQFHDFDGTPTFCDYFLLDESERVAIVLRSTVRPAQMIGYGYWYSDEPSHAREFTGTLREPVSVQASVNNAKLQNVNVVTLYVLSDGDAPPPADALMALSVITGAFGLICLIGMRIGYVAFRPGRAGSSPQLMRSLGIPAHMTGFLVGDTMTRAREMSAVVLASATGEAPETPLLGSRPGYPPGYVSSRVPHLDVAARPVFLAWTDRGSGSMRLTPSRIREAVAGTAYPFSGARPAIRLRGGRRQLLLSFADEAARDSVFGQMRTSGGLTELADGRLVAAEPPVTAVESASPDAAPVPPAAE